MKITLMVVSDMQFNHACGGYGGGRRGAWNTASYNIKKLFSDMGKKMWSKSFC